MLPAYIGPPALSTKGNLKAPGVCLLAGPLASPHEPGPIRLFDFKWAPLAEGFST